MKPILTILLASTIWCGAAVSPPPFPPAPKKLTAAQVAKLKAKAKTVALPASALMSPKASEQKSVAMAKVMPTALTAPNTNVLHQDWIIMPRTGARGMRVWMRHATNEYWALQYRLTFTPGEDGWMSFPNYTDENGLLEWTHSLPQQQLYFRAKFWRYLTP